MACVLAYSLQSSEAMYTGRDPPSNTTPQCRVTTLPQKSHLETEESQMSCIPFQTNTENHRSFPEAEE